MVIFKLRMSIVTLYLCRGDFIVIISIIIISGVTGNG